MRGKEPPIKILISVVRREKLEEANKILNNMGASACYSFLSRGLGKSETLNMLGLAQSECAVIISAIKREKAHATIAEMEQKLNFDKGDNGMIMSTTIGAISRNALLGFLDMDQKVEEINKEIMEKQNTTEEAKKEGETTPEAEQKEEQK